MQATGSPVTSAMTCGVTRLAARGAAHREPADGEAGTGQETQVPRQFAGQPFDHRPGQVGRPVAQGQAIQTAAGMKGPGGCGAAHQQRPESQPVAARRDAAGQVINSFQRRAFLAPSASWPT